MIAPNIPISPLRFSELFYPFRPGLSLGSGVWVGFPVGYSNVAAYYPGYPYAYPFQLPDGYQSVVVSSPPNPVASVAAEPVTVTSGPAGALSFQITPTTARLYVDGTYVGTAADFSAMRTPLFLPVGPHRIQILADGYRTVTFDTQILPNQIVPYFGVMQSRKI
jgi:hypothetical protein